MISWPAIVSYISESAVVYKSLVSIAFDPIHGRGPDCPFCRDDAGLVTTLRRPAPSKLSGPAHAPMLHAGLPSANWTQFSEVGGMLDVARQCPYPGGLLIRAACQAFHQDTGHVPSEHGT